MVGLVLGLAVGAIGGMVLGWWGGYSTGQADAECETSDCWPWEDMQNWKGE